MNYLCTKHAPSPPIFPLLQNPDHQYNSFCFILNELRQIYNNSIQDQLFGSIL